MLKIKDKLNRLLNDKRFKIFIDIIIIMVVTFLIVKSCDITGNIDVNISN